MSRQRTVRCVRGGLAVLMALAWSSRAPAQEHPIQFAASLSAAPSVRPGDTLRVSIVATIPAGWHLYSPTQPPGGPIATTFDVGPPTLVSLAGPVLAPPPQIAPDPNFNIESEWYEDSATFRIPLRVLSTAKTGRHTMQVRVGYQTCTNRYCLPPREDTLDVPLAVGGLAVAGSSALDVAPPLAPKMVGSSPPVPTLRNETPIGVPALPASTQGGSSISLFLWLAATMGALSLLTPCVFPMVPITISYFSRRGDATRAQAAGDAMLYAGGIVAAFTGMGLGLSLLLGVAGLNRFAASPWLNLGIAAVFVVFALSLLEVLHLALPSRLLNSLDRAASGSRFGRVTTTLLMGVTFALTTFTCTAPFVGTLLVSAARGDWRWPAAGLLVFSAVFALPFLILALVPHALTRLPRSGEWLSTLKGTLAFIELGAALKFVSNADLVLGWGIFTRQAVVALWVLLGVALAIYLLGVRFSGARLVRTRAYALPAALVGVASLFLLTGLGGRRLGELESFLPPAGRNADGVGSAGELSWTVDDLDAGLATARLTGKLVLIDFTGYTCTNCRWMEANMFPRPEVARELEQFVRVRLFTDGQGERYRQQQALEQAKFQTVALPLYAVVDSVGNPRATFLGMTRDTREFAAFLASARAGH